MASQAEIRALAQNPQLLQMYLGMLAQQQQQQAAQEQAAQQGQFFNNLFTQASQREFDARQANETRYQDILKLLGGTRNDVLADVNQFGESIVNDTNENFDRARNNALADLAARGLSGSTIRAGIEDSNAKQRSAAQTRNQDAILENRSAANERTMNNITGVMERRTDVGPDANQLINLAMQLGLSGGVMGTASPLPVGAVGGGNPLGGGVETPGGWKPPGYTPGGSTFPLEWGFGDQRVVSQTQTAPAQPQRRAIASGAANDGNILSQVLRYLGQPQATGPSYISGGQTQGFAPVQYRKHAWGGVQPISNTELATATRINGPVAGYGGGRYMQPPTTMPISLYQAPAMPRQPYRRAPAPKAPARPQRPYVGDINYLMAAGLA